MSGGLGPKSLRGPLPTFGGPPSRTCVKSVKIKEHFGTYVDLEALNTPI